MDGVISVAAINDDYLRSGQVLLVDTNGSLIVWGLPSKRPRDVVLRGREAEMKRYLTARALRER
jgi:hypothetical protein